MEPSEKGSTISKLIERFRVKPPAKLAHSSNRHNSCFQSLESDSLDLKHADLRTELGVASHVATPEKGLEDEFEISSPMPVSKVSIRPRAGQGGVGSAVRPDPSGFVANFRSDSSHISSDILQEWRAKRRNEILKYKYHTGHCDEIHGRKQDHYQRLTNKYLPKQLVPVASNPITPSPTRIPSLNLSPSIATAPPILTLKSMTRAIDTRHQSVATLDNNVTRAAMQNSAESPLAEESEKLILREHNTSRDDANTASNSTKILANHSVQTMTTKDVEVQTTPPPSPPTRGPVRGQGLDESSAWSISYTTEEESPILSGDRIGNELSPPEVPSVTDRESGELLGRVEQDELLRLLVAKASFYEQHIHNIDKLLTNSYIKS